ncbi:hypothetical protein T08_5417 [Trichinella sp. T8]|uniref:Uncharacterized protein n=1 Tax=Trichinella murrelli TaxID=144512 RepID=A0A0V0TDR3_9BILA|nr:hypothetical protein T05_12561 [Trichinella murrelli]KRZ85356.1 hypothetical protein T08_5417 [Trichinella sp. T8]
MQDTVDMMKYSSTLRGYDNFHSTVLTIGKLETLSAMLFAVATSLLRIISEKVSTECEQKMFDMIRWILRRVFVVGFFPS